MKKITQIIKLSGVPSSKIGALHDLLESPENIREMRGENNIVRLASPLAVITKSSAPDGKAYDVDITVEVERPTMLGRNGQPGGMVLTSSKILRLIYDVLGIFPEKEDIQAKP